MRTGEVPTTISLNEFSGRKIAVNYAALKELNLPQTYRTINKTRSVFFFHFSSFNFVAVYLLFKCRFVAW